ncbi:MAG TPA: hypothetical protein VFQ43_08170, partial [Nitrososphaera sp.]|nr:hypothetical protein [Nitrososphaera sp.]
PLVSYRNQSSWPPAWIWIGGNENKHPRGEVGVLKQLKLVDGPFVNRCFFMDAIRRQHVFGMPAI